MGDPKYLFEYDGKSYRAEVISAFILRKVAGDVEQQLGEPVRDVVITCPAYFGVNEREATARAGEIAGLNVRRIINEPTAAAIAYGMERAGDQVVLVYDLGGGTFDITMIEVKGGTITVLCTGGDHNLGGRDWDTAILNYLATQFREQAGSGDDILKDPETLQDLYNRAEEAKKTLSQRDKVPLKVGYSGKSARVELTKETFEELTAPRLERTITLTQEMLAEAAQKGYTRFQKILLVGGATRMPQIAQRLKEAFHVDCDMFDPDESVATGAAIFGWKLSLDDEIKTAVAERTGQNAANVDLGKADRSTVDEAEARVAQKYGLRASVVKQAADLTIRNVTSKTFGIVVVDQRKVEWVANLINRNDPVPKDITRDDFGTLEDNQDSVVIRLMENLELGEKAAVDKSTEIGKSELALPPGLPAGSPISVNFKLNDQGRLEVKATEPSSKKTIQLDVETASVMSKEEVQEATRGAWLSKSGEDHVMLALAIGIDLGTTNSAIAYINVAGRPEIIPNAEGNPITPLVIYFGSDPPLVGDQAKEMQGLGEEQIASFFKQHGRSLFPPTPGWQGPEQAVELSSFVLRKLKTDAESRLKNPIDRAVITVPAYFNNAQREATIEAGRLAGLVVLQIINEPTSAALAYRIDESGLGEKVLVYDLGGGTFDVSLVAISKDELTVVATAGDHNLGGKDWDDRIAAYLGQRFAENHRIDPLDQHAAFNDLLVRAEEAKKALSTRETTRVRMHYEGRRESFELPRPAFEKLDPGPHGADPAPMRAGTAGCGRIMG